MSQTVEFTKEELEYVQDQGYQFDCPECGRGVSLLVSYCRRCEVEFEFELAVRVVTGGE